MNKVYLRSSLLAPFCRACAQVSIFRGMDRIMQFSSIYQSRYNNEEQHKILQVINDSNTEELSRFDISKNRVNNLEQFRRKQGPFCTLEEVLEVDGLGVRVLEKLCDSILKNSIAPNENNSLSDSEIANHIKSLHKRSKYQVMSPALHSDQINMLQTAVGIHIGVSAVTWTHMDKSGNVLAWDIYNLEFGSKRPHLTFLYEIAKDICDKIAKGDIYIIEDKGISTVSTKQQQPSSISVHLQNCQLTAMFLSLLNRSLQSVESEADKFQHAVFFLRSRLPARLFGTLIGSERVSAQSVVLDILSQQIESFECSPIWVSDELKQIYLNRTAMEKEALCSALLLIMTFMDIVVHKNPLALQRIKNGSSRNK